MTKATHKPSLVVADSDRVVRDGLSQYLARVGYDVLQAGDARTALSMVPRADGAVLDISIPATPDRLPVRQGNHGLALARRIKTMRPAFGIVLFSAYEDHGQGVLELLGRGYVGIAYQMGGRTGETLIETIKRVLTGGVAFDSPTTKRSQAAEFVLECMTREERELVEAALRRFELLSPREEDVVRLWAASHTTASIAMRLEIDPRTVENYSSNIYDKLGLHQAPSHLRKSSLLSKVTVVHDLLE